MASLTEQHTETSKTLKEERDKYMQQMNEKIIGMSAHLTFD